jgi:hypothetical protein
MRLRRLVVGTASIGLVPFAVPAWSSTPAAQPDHGHLVVRVLPQSSVEVSNCIPFGNNVDYGFSGFIYRNVLPFSLEVDDRIAFDLGALNDVPARRNIYLAVGNKNPDPPEVVGGNVVSQGVAATAWVKVVSEAHSPGGRPRGNSTIGDFELRFHAEAPFDFPGGALIVGVGASPPGQYLDGGCDGLVVSTSSLDASGQFYARFCLKEDQTLAALDEAGACGGTAEAIGGIVVRRL